MFVPIRSIRSRSILLALLCLAALHAGDCQIQRPLTPSDCVRVRYLAESDPTVPIRIDPSGKRVAYVIESADLATDRALTQLYVQDLADPDPHHARLLLSGEGISGMRWLADGIHLTSLLRRSGVSSVVSISVRTGKVHILARAETDIVEYTVNRDASIIVFATLGEPSGIDTKPDDVPANSRAGYLIRFGREEAETLQQRLLYLTRRQPDGKWSRPERIVIRDPFTGTRLPAFAHYDAKIYSLRLSLSPDGQQLLFSYVSGSIPSAWKADPVIAHQMRAGSSAVVTVLVDLRSGQVTVPLHSIRTASAGSWSPDGKSFAIAAFPPVGSVWETRDIAAGGSSPAHLHLFLVNTSTDELTELRPTVVNPEYAVLCWRDARSLVVENAGAGSVSTLSKIEGNWKETAVLSVPVSGLSPYAPVASDGITVVGINQSPTNPPELFSYRSGEQTIRVITDMNTFLQSVKLASARTLHWQTSEGEEAAGLLFLPPNYDPRKRYPLVIQTKQGSIGSFACDGGSFHYPSVAPEPLASAGILYLEHQIAASPQKSDTAKKYEAKYPGQIGEVVHEMDIWQGAVRMLTEEKVIDPTKIGVIGFSRGGWYAEFMLTHSSIRFAAATATDNVQYTLGEYWIAHNGGASREIAAAYGGPPSGSTLANWLDYSMSFALPQMHTPLLIETMGYGIHDNVRGMVPANLAIRYELLTGLTELGKPVEMYYYPDEDHLIHGPVARLRNLERNVDWYRFWLLNEERPNPEDPDQYVRWRHLRLLENASGNSSPK